MKNLIRTHWPYAFPLCILATLMLTILAFSGQQAAAQEPVPTHQVYLPLVVGGSGGNNPTPTPTQPPDPTPVPLVAESVFGIAADELSENGGLVKTLNAGAGWTRSAHTLRWSDVEPVEGQRNWQAVAGLEAELRNAATLGLRVLLTVDSTPTWARPAGAECGPVLPEERAAFASFLRDAVQRYSIPPYQVKFWALWNEPDTAGEAGCWGDPADPFFGGDDYAALLATAYPQAKAADPEAQVIIGGLRLECDPDQPPAGKDCTSSRFLEGILQAGGGASFDGISFHASDSFAVYDFPWGTAYQYSNYNWQSSWYANGPVLLAKAAFIENLLDEYHVTGKALYNTQSALLCATCQSVPVFEQAKASYVAQVYASAHALGLRANIWESLFGWQNSALLDDDSLPKPAYTAFRVGRELIGAAEYAGPVLPADVGGVNGIRGYKFSQDGVTVWVVWYVSPSEGSYPLTLTTPPTAAWDMIGQPVDITNGVSAGQEPIYLEWQP